jgi:hypothetical protein
MKNYISIGFDKNGDADFAISGLIHNLNKAEFDELRKMITVAIGTMEAMWRAENGESENTKSNTDKNV